MTMHNDHHVTESEDAAFDQTLKIIGIVTVVIVGAAMAFWYFYS